MSVPSTTKKTYETIQYIFHAELLKSQDYEVRLTLENIINKLADFFERDNPKFQRDRFLKGCGL